MDDQEHATLEAGMAEAWPPDQQIREAWQDDLRRRNQSVREYKAMVVRHQGTWMEPYYRARLEAKTVARDAVRAARAKMQEGDVGL